MTVIFHGNKTEAAALAKALDHNCECTYGQAGELQQLCAGHNALRSDQRYVDGVLTYRHMADRLWAEELRR